MKNLATCLSHYFCFQFVNRMRNVPIMFRHLIRSFTAFHGSLVFRLKCHVMLALLVAGCYFFLPTDIIPERIFGLIGFIDDIIVVTLLTVLVARTYTRIEEESSVSFNEFRAALEWKISAQRLFKIYFFFCSCMYHISWYFYFVEPVEPFLFRFWFYLQRRIIRNSWNKFARADRLNYIYSRRKFKSSMWYIDLQKYFFLRLPSGVPQLSIVSYEVFCFFLFLFWMENIISLKLQMYYIVWVCM